MVLVGAGPTGIEHPAVVAELAAGLGPGGLGVVAHDAKEAMRSLLPMGVDVTNLVLDTAVGAYLLDPSTDRYHVGDLAVRFLGVEMDDGSGGPGQGAFDLGATGDDGGGEDVGGDDPERRRAARLVAVLARLRDPCWPPWPRWGRTG